MFVEKLSWHENHTKKIVTYLLTWCRWEMLGSSEEIQKYLKSISWQIGFRNQKFSRVKAAVQVIRIVNETDFLSPVNECEN